jgi:hypothetical protein
MLQLIEANWPLVAGAALLLVVAILLLRRAGKAPERREFNDVLSEGAAPAQRNTALIDAPPPPRSPPPRRRRSRLHRCRGDDLTRIKGLGPAQDAADQPRRDPLRPDRWLERGGRGADRCATRRLAGRPTRDNWSNRPSC